MKYIKYLCFFVFFVFVILLLFPFSVFATNNQKSIHFVVDKANVLERSTIDYIEKYSSFLRKSLKIDYYVITVNSFNGENIDDYANSVYDNYSINEKGMLILFSKKERFLKIITGNKLSNIVKNHIIDSYIKSYFLPFFKNGEWDFGIKNGYSSFYKLLCNYYNIDSSIMIVYNGNNFLVKYKNDLLILSLLLSTLFSYKYCVFFLNIKKKNNYSFKGYSIFSICLFLNILLLLFVFFLDKKFVIAVLGVEFIEILQLFTFQSNSRKKKKHKIKKV